MGQDSGRGEEDDSDGQDGDADARGASDETGFPFVGELRGDSDGDEDLLEKEDEDEEDEEERDGDDLFLPGVAPQSLIESVSRAFRSFLPIGAARVISSSVRATARNGAGSMDWIRGGGCSGGGDDSPFPILTLTAGPPFLTLNSIAIFVRPVTSDETPDVETMDPLSC